MGLRHGEVQALRWEDVDLEAGKLHVRRVYVRKTAFRGYPKSGKHLNSTSELYMNRGALKEDARLLLGHFSAITTERYLGRGSYLEQLMTVMGLFRREWTTPSDHAATSGDGGGFNGLR